MAWCCLSSSRLQALPQLKVGGGVRWRGSEFIDQRERPLRPVDRSCQAGYAGASPCTEAPATAFTLLPSPANTESTGAIHGTVKTIPDTAIPARRLHG